VVCVVGLQTHRHTHTHIHTQTYTGSTPPPPHPLSHSLGLVDDQESKSVVDDGDVLQPREALRDGLPLVEHAREEDHGRDEQRHCWWHVCVWVGVVMCKCMYFFLCVCVCGLV
jgi:hypothetical protein